jgi:hypothetical protein
VGTRRRRERQESGGRWRPKSRSCRPRPDCSDDRGSTRRECSLAKRLEAKANDLERTASELTQERDKLIEERDKLLAITDQQRAQLAAAGSGDESFAAAVQEVDTIRRDLQSIGDRSERRPGATLYIQVANDEQRREWLLQRDAAKELGYVVPGIEVGGAGAKQDRGALLSQQ